MPLPPIRREVLVAGDPDHAFRVFTERIGNWWPLAELSVHGEGSSVAFEDGSLVEHAADGQAAVWGEVRSWEPGSRLSFTWHPGKENTAASEVTVSFSREEEQTRVVLEHSGWESYADPVTARNEYGHGWPRVLDLYRRAAQPDEDTAETWVALMHTPGPGAPADGPLFADPRFAEHVNFLERMQERGYLVAAGPLADSEGAGMTVLRLPGENRESEAEELATKDDLAVAGGLLAVAVRPWSVMFHSVG
jgi:uncharacterized protein YndB with AHSA1/START domain/uncharacterized protein YciI